MDADDYWFPDHLKELSDLYTNFPDCGIYCSRYKIKTTSKHFSTPHFNGIPENFSGIIGNYFYSNRPSRITWTSSLAIPKEILIQYGGFTVGVTNGQDFELWTKIGIHEKIAIGSAYTSLYNYHIPGSLAKTNIGKMKLMDFSQFKEDELKNKDLKSFLDLHRFFYAMLYKSNRNYKEAVFYYKDIDKKNIGILNQILFNLPSSLLKILYLIKKTLKKTGLEFSTYN
ncbi:glycosyl transferase [Flavobacterium limnosediminis JC2902]|uniref:Glycosyl transferase n=1 Tax=Flavobacterium limnosediminis JC2902 TaxID=1341181 RepID=V6SHU8_9FLAO|nr:glycosyl transferase [Flavobacterium limnosediminis JC2902]